VANKVSNKAQEVKGRTKEAAGKSTGDRSLEARGKGDQLKAHSKQAAADLKKSARKAKQTLSR